MLGLCLGRLGWPPDVLWRATPREVAAAARGLGTVAPPTRAALAELLQRYPDAGRTAGRGAAPHHRPPE